MRYLVFIIALFAALQTNAQNNIVYGAGINYTNGAPTFTPPVRTSRAAVDTATGRWYHFNTPGGWQWIGNTMEEISGCAAPAYTPNKGDSRLVVNNCTKPQVYWYDGATWKWINEGEVYTAGQGIRIESNSIILDSLYILRFRTGSNTDGAAGTMSWNATEETVDLVTDQGAVTGHLMESAYYNTRNTTGTQIPISHVVMANGTTGNTGRILIAPAIADGSVNSEYILGLTAQAINNNNNGKVQHFGKIRGIQTNGAHFGETWVDGDVLYCSAVTPGHLTKVVPTAPNLKIPIAIVIHAHPTNGTLFVRPSHFPDLAQINDVQLSSPANGQVLTYNSTLSRWENAPPADPSATNELQTLSTGTNTLTLSNGGGTVTVDTDPASDVTGSGTSGQVSFWTGAQTQTGHQGLTYTTTENGRLYVGTPSGDGKLNLTRDAGDNFFYHNTFSTTDGHSNYWFARKSASNTIGTLAETTNGEGIGSLFFQGVNTASAYAYGAQILAQQIGAAGTFVPVSLNFRTYSSTALNNNQLFLSPNSNVGINIGAPAARLHVVGSGTSSSTWTAQFHNSAGNNNALMIRDDGNVGIGTSSPGARLQINGSTSDNTATALRASNNINQNLFDVRNDGQLGIGTLNFWYSYNAATGVNTRTPTGGLMRILYGANGATSNGYGLFIANGQTTNRDYTSGEGGGFRLGEGYAPTSGTGDYNSFLISGTINQTGGANGYTRGILIDPTLTSAADYRAIQFQNSSGWGIYGASSAKSYFAGNVAIGTTSQNASAAFEVASTTQGILFPRMTTAQRNAIATPADGLVIYNTTDNKLQVRAGGAWVDLH